MDVMKTTPERLGEALERARRQWRTRLHEPLTLPPAAKQVAFTIAISRESGAGGGSVAREVGSRLNWAVYDRELLETISAETGLQMELLESLDEHETNRAAEWLESLFGSPTISKAQFAHRLTQTLSGLSAKGRCVIVGRGAAFILPAPTTLRVRLVAPREARVARMQEKLVMSEESVASRLDEIDSLRAEFVHSQLRRDVTDVHHYDLVLNTEKFSIGQAADLIIAALKTLEHRASGQ
jgi:cytidylate kinase